MTNHPDDAAQLPRWIGWALWIWGGVLATGAYVKTPDEHGLRQALAIIGCVTLFQVFWLGMQWFRNRRLAQRGEESDRYTRKHG